MSEVYEARPSHEILPYRWAGMWVFDDPTMGLKKEPFVAGTPEMINTLLQTVGLSLTYCQTNGFLLRFSDAPFPRYHATLRRVKEEHGGNWYCWEQTQLQGWLCPALLKYFESPPELLYVRAEPL